MEAKTKRPSLHDALMRLMVRRRARAMRQYMAPLCTPLARDACRPLLREHAQRSGVLEYGVDCVFPETGHPGDGLLIWARLPDGSRREKFVSDGEIERALDAGLEWRYRLVAGPSIWRLRPLWKRRDGPALANLMRRHITIVIPA